MAKVTQRLWCGCSDPESHGGIARDCPQVRSAWIVDYFAPDKNGKRKRHIETFKRQKDAKARLGDITVEVKKGVHTAASSSITVAKAAENWIERVRSLKRERATIEQYEQHVKIHINPRIGSIKLAELSSPRVERFATNLMRDLSLPMARKVLGSLKMLLRNAKRLGDVAVNAAEDTRVETSKRHKRKLKPGIDFPLSDEVRRMADAAQGRARALLLVAAFAGLRSSELRGLRWSDVNLKAGKLTVHQRADRWSKIGRPKSEAGERTIGLLPTVTNALRELKLASTSDYVFANTAGNIDNHANLVQRVLQRSQIAAGITKPVLGPDGKPERDKRGKPLLQAKYTGLHALRHYFAALCLTRAENGGGGLTLKELQEALGHATLSMTADTYGHLLPAQDTSERLAKMERALFGTAG